MRSSFSGGGKVEASPLSPEIVSTDARFVPRMLSLPHTIFQPTVPHSISNGSRAVAVLYLPQVDLYPHSEFLTQSELIC